MSKSPLYGSDFTAKMLSPIYIRRHKSPVTARPKTSELAIETFEGVRSSGKIVITDGIIGANADGKYFLMPLNTGTLGIYFTTTPSQIPEFLISDVYLEVLIDSDDISLIIAWKLAKTLLNGLFLEVNSLEGNVVDYTVILGGHCESPIENDGGSIVTFEDFFEGSGEWSKIGKLANDLTLNPELIETIDSQGESKGLTYKYEVSGKMLNVDEYNRNALYNRFDKNQCDIAFVNTTDSKVTTLVINDIYLYFFDHPFGEAYGINFVGKKSYTTPRDYIKMWTWNNQLPFIEPIPPEPVYERIVFITPYHDNNPVYDDNSNKILITPYKPTEKHDDNDDKIIIVPTINP